MKVMAPRTLTSSIGQRRSNRLFCLATNGLAFSVGLALGVVLPLYFFVLPIDGRDRLHLASSSSSDDLLRTDFNSADIAKRNWTTQSPIVPSTTTLQPQSATASDTRRHISNVNMLREKEIIPWNKIGELESGFGNPTKVSPLTVKFLLSSSGTGQVLAPSPLDQYIHETEVDVLPATASSHVARGAPFTASSQEDHEAQTRLRWLPAGTRRPNVARQAVKDGDGADGSEGKIHLQPTVAATEVFAAVLTSLGPTVRILQQPLPLKYGEVPKFTSIETESFEPLSLSSIVNGIFWTAKVEELLPKGFEESEITQWRRFVNVTSVLKVEEGCGRMQNRLVTFDGGDKSCCRYRHNNDQIQGEIFSYYLGRILGIRNLAPSVLALVDPRLTRWASAASQVALAQWNAERPVVLTQFVENLLPAYIPTHFRNQTHRQLHPVPSDLEGLSETELADLVQWTDLVLFDYLTANLDRTVNNMYNERWNADMMHQPTHNLARTRGGLLLFLDNESGLLHGYRLLDKYEHFHRSLLDGLCVFRTQTAEAISKLYHDKDVGEQLKLSFAKGDPGMDDWLPFLPERSIKTLNDRISIVYKHITTCRSRFGPAVTTTVKGRPER